MTKKINWEESGLLEGLDSLHKKEICFLLDKTAEIFNTSYCKNERIETILFPCIRKVYSVLFVDENCSNIKIEDSDIKTLINDLDKIIPIILLLEQNFFKNKNYDIEAEMLCLFCKNFTISLKNKK